jgi:carbon monoxide dehydrogenase subunit G
MAHYVTTVNTDWDPEAAFRYLAEFSNVADWDPGVSAARNLSDAPLESGARFEVEASFLGRTVPLTYETIEIDSPRRVTLRAATGTFTSLDTLSFDPTDGGGTAVTYDAELSLNGALKLLDPALGLAFKRIGDAARDGLRKRLRQPPPS